MANRKQKLKPCPSGSFAFRRLCQYRIPIRKTLLKGNSKTKPRNNSNEKPREFSLRRCSANQDGESDRDAACNHADKTVNAKLNTSSASAAPRKIGDKDTSFSQLKKTVRRNLNRVPHVKGCISPYSRALVKQVHEMGVLRRSLSPEAAMLVKRGKPVGMAVRAVGYQQAFSRWEDGSSVYVRLKINRGKLDISRVGHWSKKMNQSGLGID